jgi:hypothetical protein
MGAGIDISADRIAWPSWRWNTSPTGSESDLAVFDGDANSGLICNKKP